MRVDQMWPMLIFFPFEWYTKCSFLNENLHNHSVNIFTYFYNGGKILGMIMNIEEDDLINIIPPLAYLLNHHY